MDVHRSPSCLHAACNPKFLSEWHVLARRCLTAGEITLTADGQQVPAVRAQPEGKSNLPVILVASEIFGMHEYIRDVARRFAKLGYLALAPNMLVRQGDPAKLGAVQTVLSRRLLYVHRRQIF